MQPNVPVVCTFIIASANRELFAEERPQLPEDGEVVSHEGHDYEVIDSVPQQLPPDSIDSELSMASSAVVRVRKLDER